MADAQTTTMKEAAHQLFYELAMHHHNYIITRKISQEELSGQPPDIVESYFKRVFSHNNAGLALTLCKVMEFHNIFRKLLPQNLCSELDQVNSRISKSRILDYRNKHVGHLLDRNTKKPLQPEAIKEYWDALLQEQTEEEFRSWW